MATTNLGSQGPQRILGPVLDPVLRRHVAFQVLAGSKAVTQVAEDPGTPFLLS